MFDYITGKIASVGENKIVVDCGGVGFLLTASSGACADYSRKEQARIPVHLVVREDALELYGFIDEKERDLFVKLISVSGVGAKLAIAVLGVQIDRLLDAIASGDANTLSAVKGVGKKTAERIVLELKGKVEATGNVVPAAPAAALNSDAVAALMGLGYDRKEAENAVNRVTTPEMTTEEIIRAVLRG